MVEGISEQPSTSPLKLNSWMCLRARLPAAASEVCTGEFPQVRNSGPGGMTGGEDAVVAVQAQHRKHKSKAERKGLNRETCFFLIPIPKHSKKTYWGR